MQLQLKTFWPKYCCTKNSILYLLRSRNADYDLANLAVTKDQHLMLCLLNCSTTLAINHAFGLIDFQKLKDYSMVAWLPEIFSFRPKAVGRSCG